MAFATSARGNRGFGGEMTVSGQRSTFNNYRIDGIGVNDYAMASPGNVIGVVLGVDAIQEFSVLTGGFPAEYGRATGGVVNAISRSGTNQFHGAVYEFLRNSALDANDLLFTGSAGTPNPPFKRNQFGVSAGAPIIKDRLFVFADYEGLRQTKGIPQSSTVFSDAVQNGFVAGNRARRWVHAAGILRAPTAGGAPGQYHFPAGKHVLCRLCRCAPSHFGRTATGGQNGDTWQPLFSPAFKRHPKTSVRSAWITRSGTTTPCSERSSGTRQSIRNRRVSTMLAQDIHTSQNDVCDRRKSHLRLQLRECRARWFQPRQR